MHVDGSPILRVNKFGLELALPNTCMYLKPIYFLTTFPSLSIEWVWLTGVGDGDGTGREIAWSAHYLISAGDETRFDINSQTDRQRGLSSIALSRTHFRSLSLSASIYLTSLN